VAVGFFVRRWWALLISPFLYVLFVLLGLLLLPSPESVPGCSETCGTDGLLLVAVIAAPFVALATALMGLGKLLSARRPGEGLDVGPPTR